MGYNKYIHLIIYVNKIIGIARYKDDHFSNKLCHDVMNELVYGYYGVISVTEEEFYNKYQTFKMGKGIRQAVRRYFRGEYKIW